MATRRVMRGAPSAIRQRGQAALLTVLILALGFGAVFYSFFGSAWQSTNTDRITHDALAQAKVALIGYAAADPNRPGSLPCPDTDNDGIAQSPIPTDCASYIGRLPWRTLGLPDLRDGSGERLWYAVSRVFATNPTNTWCAPNCPLNSDTKGVLTVTGTSPAANVIAIVFSAGLAVGAQNRSPANENNVAHYLEGGNETGIGTSTFYSATTTATFNDRLLLLKGGDVMTPVEMRAAREILTLLWAYRSFSDCACYPWADRTDDSTTDGISDNDYLAGRVPLVSASPESWSSLNINTTTYPALTWLRNNRWWWVFFYTVARSESQDKTWGDYLTINGVPNTSVVLITTGPAGAGRPTPVASWTSNSNWAAYVDDPDNFDMGVIFFTPWSTAYERDRLYTLF